MRKFVWLSFDLGVQGDYEGMYDFLDQHQAKECGDSLACFWYEATGDLVDTMTIAIHNHMDIGPKARIYLIWLEGGKLRGKFLFGKRKNPLWAGHAVTGETETDSSDE